jgi:hypothetical protein
VTHAPCVAPLLTFFVPVFLSSVFLSLFFFFFSCSVRPPRAATASRLRTLQARAPSVRGATITTISLTAARRARVATATSQSSSAHNVRRLLRRLRRIKQLLRWNKGKVTVFSSPLLFLHEFCLVFYFGFAFLYFFLPNFYSSLLFEMPSLSQSAWRTAAITKRKQSRSVRGPFHRST